MCFVLLCDLAFDGLLGVGGYMMMTNNNWQEDLRKVSVNAMHKLPWFEKGFINDFTIDSTWKTVFYWTLCHQMCRSGRAAYLAWNYVDAIQPTLPSISHNLAWLCACQIMSTLLNMQELDQAQKKSMYHMRPLHLGD